MTIYPTTEAGGSTNGAGSTPGLLPRNDGLGKDAFLQLLVTQLKNQDPSKPLDDSAFLAQLAQFSSLEKLTEISTSIQTLGAILLGALPADDGNNT